MTDNESGSATGQVSTVATLNFILATGLGLILSTACNSNTFRIAAANIDDLAKARGLGDDIARALATSRQPAANRAATRVKNLATRFQVSEDLEGAFYALVWDVGCELVTEDAPLTRADAANRLAERAARFGLAFTDDAVQRVGEALIEVLGSSESLNRSETAEACANLPDRLR